jgi:hypothetical protein
LFLQKDFKSFVRNTLFTKCWYVSFVRIEYLTIVTISFVLLRFVTFFSCLVLHHFSFEFCGYLSYWVLLQFVFLSFVTVWDFRFCHSLSFWVFMLFEIGPNTICLSLVTIWGFRFVTVYVFECCHNLTFCVLAHFE